MMILLFFRFVNCNIKFLLIFSLVIGMCFNCDNDEQLVLKLLIVSLNLFLWNFNNSWFVFFGLCIILFLVILKDSEFVGS